MAKLYLIRRNLETFTGPMTLAEMKEAYKRMQFGLQDEISGHCGPWVQFDALEKIKKHYPEVARIVHEDMLAGWGVSNHGERIVNEDTKRIEVKSNKGVGLALTFLVIALVAFAAAVYMANSSKLSGKIKDPGGNIRPEEPQGFLNRGDAAGFEAYMAAHTDDMVDRLVKKPKPEPQWLPYLRLYAFTHEGFINGLDPKWLRGDGAAAAPLDCSQKEWRTRWRGSKATWPDFVVKRQLVRAHWARMLAWDPHWIRRRDNTGWIGSQNFYVGCLTMADKALSDLAGDTTAVASAADWDRLGLSKIKSRLTWLIEMTTKGQSSQPTAPALDNNLAIWTCFEAAKDVPSLNQCRQGLSSDQDVWQAYTEERYGWNLVRIAAGSRGVPTADLSDRLNALASKMNKEDHFTRFDYRAEIRLLKAMVKTGTPVERAVEKTQSEFPDVKLTH